MGFEEAVEDAIHAVELAGDLNADCLLIASGTRAGHIRSHCRRLVIDALRRVADEAGEHDVTLALQPLTSGPRRHWSFIRSIDAAIDLISECDHPQLKLGFHAGQLRHEYDLVGRIRDIARHVALVQLCDWPADECGSLCLPGDGLAPLSSIVAAFQDADYSGAFEVDMWSDAVWKSNYLQLLLDIKSRFHSLLPAPLVAEV